MVYCIPARAFFARACTSGRVSIFVAATTHTCARSPYCAPDLVACNMSGDLLYYWLTRSRHRGAHMPYAICIVLTKWFTLRSPGTRSANNTARARRTHKYVLYALVLYAACCCCTTIHTHRVTSTGTHETLNVRIPVATLRPLRVMRAHKCCRCVSARHVCMRYIVYDVYMIYAFQYAHTNKLYTKTYALHSVLTFMFQCVFSIFTDM